MLVCLFVCNTLLAVPLPHRLVVIVALLFPTGRDDRYLHLIYFATVCVALPLLYHNSHAKFVCFSALAFTIATHRYSTYSIGRTHLSPLTLTLPCLCIPFSKALKTAHHFLKKISACRAPFQPPRTHHDTSGLFQAQGAFSTVRFELDALSTLRLPKTRPQPPYCALQ